MRLQPLWISFVLVATNLLPFVHSRSLTKRYGETGTFQNPASRVRPRFRYWLPDSSVDPSIVATNIKDAGSIGAGGVEFLPFFDYGGQLGVHPPGADWVTYGFGTPAFQNMFRAALEAHKEAGLNMDFPLGPNQGQGVPAETDDEGLQWDLFSFSASVPSNGSLPGIIPGWGSGQFIALVSARVLSTTNITLTGGSVFSASQSYYLKLLIDHTSLNDLTQQVSSSGHISGSLPVPGDGSDYRLFAYYQARTLNKNLEFSNNSTATIFDNGSYIVDHYSARGAQTVTKFWEEYILTDGVKQLLMEVGNYGWEDSIEMTSNISWTPKLPERFQEKFGYSLLKYLPIIMWGDNNINIQSNSPGEIRCVLDTPDSGVGYINDYRSVLVDGYREYLEALTNWTHNYLGLEMSAQVSYNLPMDMEANIPFVDAPECESLQFNDNIDGYRQFSGSANLAGKNVISNEMGAISRMAYHYTIGRLLFSINSAFSGGVNQFVLHGGAYTGDYYGTTWPGYTAFSYIFSESWSNKQPVWDHGFSEALNYVARTQYIQQTGIPKTDVALYNKVSATNPNFPTLYQASDLVQEGWSYSYISPDNFDLPEAQVKSGILAPNGPAFKAIVLTSENNVTLPAVKKLQSFAQAGLPVIISGGTPGYYSTANASTKAAVGKALSQLIGSKNVYSVGNGEVASKLASIGLAPNVKTQTNGTWYTTWRKDSVTDVDYAFVFNNYTAASGYIKVLSTKTPYLFDAWTGKQKPILAYTVQGKVTTIPLSLTGNQTVIIAFSNKKVDGVDKPSLHATSAPPNVIGSSYTQSSGWTAQVAKSSDPTSASQSIALSNGKSLSISKQASSVPAKLSLGNWTLVAEHWEAPDNLYDASVIAKKHNTTHQLTSLVSWLSIPALTNTSGLGYYSTSFTWPPTSKSSSSSVSGAYLSLPPILHAVRVYINGHSVGPIDYTAPLVDIGPYLRPNASNELLAIVPSTMWNYLLSILGKIVDQGGPPQLALLGAYLGSLPAATDNGLIGTVEVIPYVNVGVKG